MVKGRGEVLPVYVIFVFLVCLSPLRLSTIYLSMCNVHVCNLTFNSFACKGTRDMLDVPISNSNDRKQYYLVNTQKCIQPTIFLIKETIALYFC